MLHLKAETTRKAKSYRSIALPAIRSGIFDIPKDVCADIMIQAAQNFSKKHQNCALKEIHFVNIDDATGKVFVKEFLRKFRGRSSFKNYQAKTPKSRFGSPDSRSFAKTKERKKKGTLKMKSVYEHEYLNRGDICLRMRQKDNAWSTRIARF